MNEKTIVDLTKDVLSKALGATRAAEELAARVGLGSAVEATALASVPGHRRNHVRRARKPWKCSKCSQELPKGETYFAAFNNAEDVVARLHLGCVTAEDLCCPKAAEQVREFVPGLGPALRH